MANIIRSAKYGSDWGENELDAFNIEVRRVDTETFFGQAALPHSTVSPVILNNIDKPADCNKTERKFFGLLEDAILAEESHVDDFAAFLLDLLDYNVGDRLIHSHKELGFMMCGQRVLAKPDVCLVDHSGRGACLLLVQEDKRATSNSDPEPQLIAEAIAAFSETRLAMRLSNQPVPVAKTMAGIAMIGSAPIFYKIPITRELLSAIGAGQFPQTPTIVQCLFPLVANQTQYVQTGMKPLDQRRTVLECFEAFKAFL